VIERLSIAKFVWQLSNLQSPNNDQSPNLSIVNSRGGSPRPIPMPSGLDKSAVERIVAIALGMAAFATWAALPLLQRIGAGGTLIRLSWHAVCYALLIATGLLVWHAAKHATTRRGAAVLCASLLLFTVLLRGPSHFTTDGPGDEASLLVMGWSISDGSLPYTRVWDIKPPGSYFASALLTGWTRDLFVVRVIASLLVWVSACALALARAPAAWKTPAIGPLLLIVFISETEAGRELMTEHVVLLPLTIVAILALQPRPTPRQSAVMGFCLAAAVTVRTNLAFMLPALVLIMRPGRSEPPGASAKRVSALIAGSAVPFVLMVVPFAIAGKLENLVRGILAPLVMPGAGPQFIPSSADNLFIDLIAPHAWDGALLIWVAGLGGAAAAWRSGAVERRDGAANVLLLLMAQFLSIMAMSASTEHYLLMCIPYLAVLGGAWLERAVAGTHRQFTTVALLVGMLAPVLMVPGQYAELAPRIIRGEPACQTDSCRMASYLREHGASAQYVYTLGSGQIAQWIADTKFAGRFAEPREMLVEPLVKHYAGPAATVEGELLEGFRHDPLFVIADVGETLPASVVERLAQDYGRPMHFGQYFLYERRRGATLN